jgi:hypothetical protein
MYLGIDDSFSAIRRNGGKEKKIQNIENPKPVHCAA